MTNLSIRPAVSVSWFILSLVFLLRGKTNSNWKGSLFQLQLHSCEAALPLSDDWLLPSHWQSTTEMHFCSSLLLLGVFICHLFGWHVEEMAVTMQHWRVATFCWLIMESISLTPLKHPLSSMWSLFFRLWVFSHTITNLAVTDLSLFSCDQDLFKQADQYCWIIMVIIELRTL